MRLIEKPTAFQIDDGYPLSIVRHYDQYTWPLETRVSIYILMLFPNVKSTQIEYRLDDSCQIASIKMRDLNVRIGGLLETSRDEEQKFFCDL